MRYTVVRSIVRIVGPIWQPGFTCAQVVDLNEYDVENIRALGDGLLTRNAVHQWLDMNAGDFRSITDFEAEIEEGNSTTTFPWTDEESELVFSDAMVSDIPESDEAS